MDLEGFFFEVGSSDPLDGCDFCGPKRTFFWLVFLYWSTVIAEALIMWAKSTLYEYCICERVLALPLVIFRSLTLRPF